MASKIKLKNQNGVTLTLENNDNALTDKVVSYFDTVLELEGYVGTDGDVLHVSDKDRGGIFIYDSTATHNGGTVFGKCVRQYSGAVNVKWFGSTITDSIVQLAYDSLVDGEALFIPYGDYSNEVTINLNKSNVTILNYGNFTVTANASRPMFHIREGVSNVKFINHGVLDHNHTNFPGGISAHSIILISDNDTPTLWTENIHIENYGVFKDGSDCGIYYYGKTRNLTIDPAGRFEDCFADGITGDGDNENLVIRNGKFLRCGYYGQAIVAIAKDSIVAENVIDGQVNGLEYGLSGISVGYTTPRGEGYRTSIINNTIRGLGNRDNAGGGGLAAGIILKGDLSDNSLISGNRIIQDTVATTSFKPYGIVCSGSASADGYGGIITANEIIGDLEYGIIAENLLGTNTVDAVVISGNFIDVETREGSVGMYLTETTSVVVTGNKINADRYGIYVNGITECVFNSNKVNTLSVTDNDSAALRIINNTASCTFNGNILYDGASTPITYSSANSYDQVITDNIIQRIPQSKSGTTTITLTAFSGTIESSTYTSSCNYIINNDIVYVEFDIDVTEISGDGNLYLTFDGLPTGKTNIGGTVNLSLCNGINGNYISGVFSGANGFGLYFKDINFSTGSSSIVATPSGVFRLIGSGSYVKSGLI